MRRRASLFDRRERACLLFFLTDPTPPAAREILLPFRHLVVRDPLSSVLLTRRRLRPLDFFTFSFSLPPGAAALLLSPSEKKEKTLSPSGTASPPDAHASSPAFSSPLYVVGLVLPPLIPFLSSSGCWLSFFFSALSE